MESSHYICGLNRRFANETCLRCENGKIYSPTANAAERVIFHSGKHDGVITKLSIIDFSSVKRKLQ